jgi:SNF2-related domain/Helicase conserved C-terminal domain
VKLRDPLPHQTKALASEQLTGDHAGLFMDMRLGKSLVLLRWLDSKQAKLTLLVAPDLPLADWQDECAREGFSFVRIIGSKKKRLQLAEQFYTCKKALAEGDRIVVAVTYETLRATPELLEVPWEAIALDESTHIKNPQAQITKLLMRVAQAPLRACLAGLPRPQSPMDIFAQMQWLCGGTFMGHGNFWKWRERLFFQAGFTWMPRAGTLQAIKDAVHEEAVVMTKGDVGLTRHVERKTLRAPLDKAAAAMQDQIVKDWAAEDFSTLYAPVRSGWLERLPGGHNPGGEEIPCWKYDALVEFLEGTDEQAVIWARYTHELQRIGRILWKSGHNAAILNGEVIPTARKSVLEEFRSGKIKYLVCQPQLVRYGVDLACADLSVYFSCDYSHLTRRQSEERTSHPTKTRPTMIVDMISTGSADEIIQEALREHKADSAWFMQRARMLVKAKVQK